MAKKRVTLSEQIRRAVNESGMSRYAICKAIGVHESGMSRFMNGQGGLQLNNLDALSDLLKLNLKPKLKAGGK